VTNARLPANPAAYGSTPTGETLVVANGANALTTMAAVKESIMLSGGVFASMALSAAAFKQFLDYKPKSSNDSTSVLRVTENLSRVNPIMHAIFCYGWWDNPRDLKDGWWLCKNRCGP
jgi:hypothetical protein